MESSKCREIIISSAGNFKGSISYISEGIKAQ
jgi:hypothetical protein